MLDYLIVGSGLAGMALTENLLGRDRSLVVFDDASLQASRVAGGLYNPVVLKRFTLSWEGDRLMDFSLPFYRGLQTELGITADVPHPIYRRLASAEEQNAWFEAADRPGLSRFLSPRLIRNENTAVDAPFGFGEVLHTGRIRTGPLMEAYRARLLENGLLRTESFDHAALQLREGGLEYKGVQARRIVFCEGFGMRGNPFFDYLPLQGTKGELITITAPGLHEERAIKSGVFLIPLGQDRYRVGATYQWNDYSQQPTRSAREELLAKLNKFVRCDVEVNRQVAGIRPTVPDRRPLVGGHPVHPALFTLNGMGSRGVLIAPFAADCLVRLMEEGEALPPEIDIARYAASFGKGNQ